MSPEADNPQEKHEADEAALPEDQPAVAAEHAGHANGASSGGESSAAEPETPPETPEANDAGAEEEAPTSVVEDAPADTVHDGADTDEPATAPADGATAEAPAAPAEPDNKRWYVVKVASGREDTIKAAIERKVKIEGLGDSFGQIVVPVERRTELVRGKRVVKETKLMPGYLLVYVEFNERILYLFRETSGVGDFVGGALNKPPQPMPDREVERWVRDDTKPRETDEPPKSKFTAGDHVKVKDGTFAGMDGTVKEILEQKGALVVELTIFGRPVPVELEYWQVDFV